MKCPNCDGTGAIAVQTQERHYVTHDMASDACCPEMEGQLYCDEEWEQQYCPDCEGTGEFKAEEPPQIERLQ